MAYPIDLPFNKKPSTLMHIDLNSCFATIEQQANPLLQGKPIAVAAYTTPSGCILAPSIEAKKYGVKVGMRVRDGKLICPNLQILSPDPWKYRNIHLQLRNLISQYTNNFVPKSIDEFVLNFEGYPAFNLGMFQIGKEIKAKIKSEIGDWLTVSIGIAPNRFLAKLASGLKKPDGLEEINYQNYMQVFSKLDLVSLPGIKIANATRLNLSNIYTVMDFYNSDIITLKHAFSSITGYYWYLRLKGWEIDDVEFSRRSFGNMYSLPEVISSPAKLAPILYKLVEKASLRMRHAGLSTQGVHVGLLYRDNSFWHHGSSQSIPLFDSRDIYKAAFRIMSSSPYQKPVANISVSLFKLSKNNFSQLDLFGNLTKKINLVNATDKIKEKWGDFIITPAAMLAARDHAPDRIAFGNINELEQFILTA
jgi:DNA polymerase-4